MIWGYPYFRKHPFDLWLGHKVRPERRHASIMNGSGTESRKRCGWLMVEFENSHMHKNLKNFQKMTNGIGDMTLFHIFCEQNCQLRIWRFSFTHSVFWNEIVCNHLCVLWKKTSEINMNPNNPFTKSLIYSIYDLHVHPPKKRLSFFFSSNRFFFFGGGKAQKHDSRDFWTLWNFTNRTLPTNWGGFFGSMLSTLLFPRKKMWWGCLGPLKETQETHMKWASLS